MEKIKELLNQISKIVVEEKTQQEERRKRGENFNIFKVLGLSSSEVRLHSAFLAELLNPNGDHGLGDKFLLAFLDGVVRKIEGFNQFAFDTTSANVYVEYVIGQISSDETEGGRIDILLEDKNHQTIIIENKIYAGDQPKQLLRYYNYATKSKKLSYTQRQFVLLYLTLNRSAPSESSLGLPDEIKVEYEPIGYQKDVIDWLRRCIGIAALHPQVRETISQYINNLNQLMNIMEDSNKQKLLNVLRSNLSEAVNILSLESEIRKEVRRHYIKHVLTEIATKRGFLIGDNIDDFVNLVGNSFIEIYIEEYKDYGAFVIRLDPYRGYLCPYYGIMVKENIKNKKADVIWKRQLDYFPFGYEYCSYTSFDTNPTIIQMQKEAELNVEIYPDGTIAKEIDDQLKIIKEKNLLGKLKDL